MNHQKIHFSNSRGIALVGYINQPETVRAWALYAPCFTCHGQNYVADNLGAELAALGIATLRIDFTGLGGSEGDFAETSFTTQCEDLLAAAEYLQRERQAPALLIGHSLGGAVALTVANELPSVKAIATLNAPSTPTYLLKLFKSLERQLASRGYAQLHITGQRYTITQEFVADLNRHALPQSLAGLRAKLLVMHVLNDQVVDDHEAQALLACAPADASFISLGQRTHLLPEATDANYVAQLIASWGSPYLVSAYP